MGIKSGQAQGLACGKNSVHEEIAFPTYPISVPVSSLSCQTPAGLRILHSTFHSPTQSKPVTVVWVCAGNKRGPESDRTFLSPACSESLAFGHSNQSLEMTWPCHQSPQVMLPGMSAIPRQTSFGIVRPKGLAHVGSGTGGKGKVL